MLMDMIRTLTGKLCLPQGLPQILRNHVPDWRKLSSLGQGCGPNYGLRLSASLKLPNSRGHCHEKRASRSSDFARQAVSIEIRCEERPRSRRTDAGEHPPTPFPGIRRGFLGRVYESGCPWRFRLTDWGGRTWPGPRGARTGQAARPSLSPEWTTQPSDKLEVQAIDSENPSNRG